MSASQLWDRLRADGLVEGDMPPPDHAASPWYVRVMLGIAGWIGAGFLLGFVGAAFAFIMDDAGPALVLGAFCCGAAFALFRAFAGNDFAEQFGLAVSLAGQALILIGIGQVLEPADPPFYFAAAAVQAGLAFLVPNFLHRVLATGGAAIALALGIAQLEFHGFAAPVLCLGIAFIWLDPARWAAGGRIWRPIGYGLVFALLLVEAFRLFGLQDWIFSARTSPSWMQRYGPMVGRGIVAAILVWVALVLVRREPAGESDRVTGVTAAAAILFGLLSIGAPGLGSAVLILLLGYAAGSRILVALGILSLLGFVSHFYYSLHASLLEKSGLLAVTGLCLLAAWFALRRFLPPAATGEAAHA